MCYSAQIEADYRKYVKQFGHAVTLSLRRAAVYLFCLVDRRALLDSQPGAPYSVLLPSLRIRLPR